MLMRLQAAVNVLNSEMFSNVNYQLNVSNSLLQLDLMYFFTTGQSLAIRNGIFLLLLNNNW